MRNRGRLHRRNNRLGLDHKRFDLGLLGFLYRLPQPRVDEMRDALDELIRRNPGVRPEKLVSAHIEGDNGEGVHGSAKFLELARDPEIVELVSGVIGEDEDIIAVGDRLVAEGRVLRAGRRIVVVAADVFAEGSSGRRHVATMLGTMVPVDA